MDVKYTQETTQVYYFKYMREYRAVAVLWGIMTVIWCILTIVAFVQPQWIGDTEFSPGFGHFGIYAYCFPSQSRYKCIGNFGDFASISNGTFQAVTLFVGISALFGLVCVAALLLFFCLKKYYVFIGCGIMEIISAVLLFLACVVYPSGWDLSSIRDMCGPNSGPYKLDKCGIRWAYILAILGIIDAALLGILAIILASIRVKPEDYTVTGKITRAELYPNYNDTLRSQATIIRPTMMSVPDMGDNYSEYSHISNKKSLINTDFRL
ncbi:LHFPL tetraspan subfamily member 3 protein-like [Argonauta hians]